MMSRSAANRWVGTRRCLGFVKAKEPVQGDTAHGLGIRVVPRLGPNLPNAGVRLPPAATHGLAETCEQLRRRSVDPLSARDELIGGVDDLPIDVELQLARSGVPHAHRS